MCYESSAEVGKIKSQRKTYWRKNSGKKKSEQVSENFGLLCGKPGCQTEGGGGNAQQIGEAEYLRTIRQHDKIKTPGHRRGQQYNT